MNNKKILIKTNLASFDLESKDCVKKRYETREEAKEGIKKYSEKYNNKQRLYYCNKCDGFHLTTKTLEQMEVINARHERRIEMVADYWKCKIGVVKKTKSVSRSAKKPIKFTQITPDEINKKRNHTYEYKY
jgi:GTPase involved in cell partitioning and DNA repair